MENNQNPLKGYFRQTAIYLKLPSQGRWYPPNNVTMNDNFEVGVMPMTAKDELILKTPDALMNGQAVADVIKSCIPDIKDPWGIPSVDMDSILIAIRLATYGDQMSITTSVPNTTIVNEVAVNLSALLDQVGEAHWIEEVALPKGLRACVRPMDYRSRQKVSQKTYEEQRLLRTVTDSTLSETEKVAKYNEIFGTLSSLTVGTMAQMVTKIITDTGEEVVNPIHIQEFVYNMDIETANTIKKHIATLSNAGEAPPVKIKTTQEQRDAGGPEEYESKIQFNNSDFFALKS